MVARFIQMGQYICLHTERVQSMTEPDQKRRLRYVILDKRQRRRLRFDKLDHPTTSIKLVGIILINRLLICQVLHPKQVQLLI